MGQRKILDILAMSRMYNRLPSEFLGIEDHYTAYCFDEACAVIQGRIENNETPKFKVKYKSFTDIYKNMGVN